MTSTEPITCGWLIQRPSNNPEPDFPEDCYVISECGEPIAETIHQVGGVTVHLRGRHALCTYHQGAMDLPESEFDRISERHDGRAFS